MACGLSDEQLFRLLLPGQSRAQMSCVRPYCGDKYPVYNEFRFHNMLCIVVACCSTHPTCSSTASVITSRHEPSVVPLCKKYRFAQKLTTGNLLTPRRLLRYCSSA